MSLRKLPQIKALDKFKNLDAEMSQEVLNKWKKDIKARANDENVIEIYDVIGEDFWGNGITVKSISDALKSANKQPITVIINSPGGDFFDGVSIYNLLREYPAKVTVKIIGIAASAASVIAMAGDEIQIAKSAYLMIHNAWICGCGNRNDFADFIKVLEQLDNSMAEVYADRTGIKIEEIKEYMDKETYFSGSIAVENDFADSLLQDEEIKKEEDDENKTQSSIRKVDILLAKQGLTRSERKTLLKDIKGGMSGTVANATLDAGLKDIDVSMQLIKDAINILSK